MTATRPTVATVEDTTPARLSGPYVVWYEPTKADIRRCMYCGLPITFSFQKFPAVRSRQGKVTHYAFAHVDEEACQHERDRRAPTADPRDLGVIRARMLDALCDGKGQST